MRELITHGMTIVETIGLAARDNLCGERNSYQWPSRGNAVPRRSLRRARRDELIYLPGDHRGCESQLNVRSSTPLPLRT
jgi:hypothetical protein